MNSMVIPSVRCSSRSRVTSEACTETSSDEVTSSQTSSRGRATSARATAARWRSPPLSSWRKALR